jgi:hypothetical protein
MRLTEARLARTGVAALLVGLAAGCGGPTYRNPIAGTVYLPTVPESELARAWTLDSDPAASLLLRADQSCVASSEVTAYFEECEQAYPAASHSAVGCGWTVAQGRTGNTWADRGRVVVTFLGRNSAWRSADFGVFRNVQSRALVLVGTCGLGDAYGLWPTG